jgi:hypothetical protein
MAGQTNAAGEQTSEIPRVTEAQLDIVTSNARIIRRFAERFSLEDRALILHVAIAELQGDTADRPVRVSPGSVALGSTAEISIDAIRS